MKKLIYVCALLLVGSVFSSFKEAAPVISKSSTTAKQFTQVVGYFTQGGITFEVWATGIPGVVTDVYNYSSSSPTVDSFSGNIDSGGVLRVNVGLSNGTSFYYSRKISVTPPPPLID